MENFPEIHYFLEIPLPYQIVKVPPRGQKHSKTKHKLKYFVNKVITNLTRDVFKHCGFKPTTDPNKWNISWGRQFSSNEYITCKGWQKINHFAGAYLIGRKDTLHLRMMELRSKIGKEAKFYPRSYLLPDDKIFLKKAWHKKDLWISKPLASARGIGIKILKSSESSIPKLGLVQVYIPNPLLITGRKFDLRIYICVTSLQPLKIYIHSNGLARFSTHLYDPTTTDQKAHLTNFSINRTDQSFIRCEGEEKIEDSKWTLPFFFNYLKIQGIDTVKLQKEIERVSIMTIIAGINSIREVHHGLICHPYTSYEMYGIDLMIDEKFQVHLIEVNISPSMNGKDSKLDYDMKFGVVSDLLSLARIIQCDPESMDPCPCLKALEKAYKESKSRDRVDNVLKGKPAWKKPIFADFVMIRDFLEEQMLSSFGGFHLIFPEIETMHDYCPCFDHLTYEDIVLSQYLSLNSEQKEKIYQKYFDIYSSKILDIKSSF